MAYPNQYIDTDILHVSRDHIIMPDTVKITFNLDIELIDKIHMIVKNVEKKDTNLCIKGN